jgi:hypothetical protein
MRVCVIIDADVASLVFRYPPDLDFAPVFNWLTDPLRNGCLAYGGRLTGQLRQIGVVRRWLVQLDRAGRAHKSSDEEVTDEEQSVTPLCKSDDPHIIALARISGARTLCSRDGGLHQDFTNGDLVATPRGAVYQNPTHTHLLRHTSSCPQERQRRRANGRRAGSR